MPTGRTRPHKRHSVNFRWLMFPVVFNAKNPFVPLTTQRVSPAGVALASFMQPTAFAGDFRQPEQRLGQIGFRITF